MTVEDDGWLVEGAAAVLGSPEQQPVHVEAAAAGVAEGEARAGAVEGDGDVAADMVASG